ncbi:hypothetical protein TEA_005410 [Camellia sinensis var. sinensis]|uniref:uracil phosphoribosyltransferase n=1 Tax=Camellia sinensis var. sinensis TaxID=542762 RepID=A0A4S4DCB0_CAMSN|nr:hypothetical protein TEA_005410 [Camellia sinensis var. sinensis]
MECRINTPLRCLSGVPFFSSLHFPRSLHSLNLLLPSSSFNPNKISYCSNSRRPSCMAVKSQTTMSEKSISENRMLVFVPPHPLIKHWVAVLRNEQTPCPIFKNAMAELGRLLMYEASRDWLPTITGEIQSPMGVASVEFIDPREPVAIVPILRAGLALAEHASSILPATRTYHLEISRFSLYSSYYVVPCCCKLFSPFSFASVTQYISETVLTGLSWLVSQSMRLKTSPVKELAQPIGLGVKSVWCGLVLRHFCAESHPLLFISSRYGVMSCGGFWISKLPDKFSEVSRVFVVDPMLATGGTIVAALDLIKERGVDNNNIKVVSAVASPPALQNLSEKFPGLHVYAGIIDPIVNDKGDAENSSLSYVFSIMNERWSAHVPWATQDLLDIRDIFVLSIVGDRG